MSYSHKDEDLRNELENHLAVLKDEGRISTWYDRNISAGGDWEGQIDEHLHTAPIILLLVSSDYLASQYCKNKEMDVALDRHARGTAKVIPVLLRECLWQRTRLAKLQCLPKNGKPVKSWKDRDKAFAAVAKGICAAADELIQARQFDTESALAKMVEAGRIDSRNAAAISQQIQADAQRQQAERWRILQETQTKILDIMQIAPRANDDDAFFHKWDEYIRG